MRLGHLNDDSPLVTIGLPVFNGERRLAEALDSLLAFHGASFVIRIFDNASTDRTGEIAAAYMARDSRVRYERNEKNIGAANNFAKAIASAETPYFMWASDDDRWQANFLAELLPLLIADERRVLATPAAIHLKDDGAYAGRIETASPAGDAKALLKSLFRQNASCWIYGLYRTDWLQREAARLAKYPPFGCDVIWLATVAMNEAIAGSDRTAIFKRQRKGGTYYRSDEEGFRLWSRFYFACRREIAARAPSASIARLAQREATGLVYRSYVKRTNPLKALFRPAQLSLYALRQRLGKPLTETDLFADRARPATQS